MPDESTDPLRRDLTRLEREAALFEAPRRLRTLSPEDRERVAEIQERIQMLRRIIEAIASAA